MGKKLANWISKKPDPKGTWYDICYTKFIEIHKTFYMFYKIEQAGESIHAVLNEILRKIWSIHDPEERI